MGGGTTQRSRSAIARLLLLPFVDVMTEVGIASAYPQFLGWYGSSLQASTAIAIGPLAAVTAGWLWGPLTRRFGVERAAGAALTGWCLGTAMLGLFYQHYPAVAITRFAHGFFAAGFAAVPFIALTKSAGSTPERARLLGRLEATASAGSLCGPIAVGAGLVLAPRPVLLVTATVTGLLYASARRASGRLDLLQHTDNRQPGVARLPRGRIHLLALPIAVASAAALLLSASETLVPTVAEAAFGEPLLGKGAAMLFEVTVLVGILLKARSATVSPGTPVWLTALLLATWALHRFGEPAILGSLLVAGIGIGALVSIGNTLATRSTRGFEETGMGIYATLRITGSFAGPLVMNLPFPGILVTLAGVSAVTVLAIWRSLRRDDNHPPAVERKRLAVRPVAGNRVEAGRG